ncbi:MAG: hypothetical protein QOJ40_2289 [Verrucomicrobiota bacterium]
MRLEIAGKPYPSSSSASGNYIWTVKHSIAELHPTVIAALRRLNPTIDIGRVKRAINSALGHYKTTVRTSAIPRTEPAKVRQAANALLKAVSQTVPGQFFLWHEQAKAQCESDPAFECDIPSKFHRWLSKSGLRSEQKSSSPE